MAIDTLNLLAATVFSATSVIILRLVWRKSSSLKAALLLSGWILFLLGGLYWVDIKGWEYGLVYHLSIASLTAWALVAINAEYKPPITAKAKLKHNDNSPQRPLITTAKFLLAGPISGLAACIVLLAFSELLPVNQINQLVITGIGFPFLWGALAVWICAYPTLLKQTLSILLSSLCSLGILLY